MSSLAPMSDSDYRIRRTGRETVAYDEGDGRTLSLTCLGDDEPPYVMFPGASQWHANVPAWAVERRRIIWERLRAAGLVLHEQAGDGQAFVLSPAGDFRVETVAQPEDRGLWFEQVRVVPTGATKPLVQIDAGLRGGPVFVSPGVVLLTLSFYGVAVQTRIDVHAGTFGFHPTETLPIGELPARLRQFRPPSIAAGITRRPTGTRAILSNLFWTLVGVVFVGGGIWMTVAGKTTKDRWIGLGSAAFFGLCLYFTLKDLVDAVRGRSPSPPGGPDNYR